MAGKGSAPGERRGGRQKGTPNHITANLKSMILAALDGVGGEKYLRRQADENPTAFMTLIGKLIPIDVDVTKTQINVTVGLYPDEQLNERYTTAFAQEAAPRVH